MAFAASAISFEETWSSASDSIVLARSDNFGSSFQNLPFSSVLAFSSDFVSVLAFSSILESVFAFSASFDFSSVLSSTVAELITTESVFTYVLFSVFYFCSLFSFEANLTYYFSVFLTSIY